MPLRVLRVGVCPWEPVGAAAQLAGWSLLVRIASTGG